MLRSSDASTSRGVRRPFLWRKMPTVGKKKFAYTPKGEAKAKSYAKKTGQKMIVKKTIAKDSGMPSKKAVNPNPTFQASAGHVNANTPNVPFGTPRGFQMPPEPANLTSQIPPTPLIHPLVPMSPGMIASIRKSPTGVVPTGLKKWMLAHGKGVK